MFPQDSISLALYTVLKLPSARLMFQEKLLLALHYTTNMKSNKGNNHIIYLIKFKYLCTNEK